MLLAIDIGNSQTSFGLFHKDQLVAHWRSETKVSRTTDEYAAFLFPLLQLKGITLNDLTGIAICSVVPAVDFALQKFCVDYFKKTPFFINSKIELGFKICVDNPGEVGADRLANAAYAVKHMKLPAIVVDLGTATTFDVVKPGPTYEGGIILPGVQMGAESLSRKTSLLPLINVEFPKSVIGKNTVTCIQSGILYGYCDAIDGLLTRLVSEIGDPCEIALTGGVAPLIHSKLKHPTQILPNLTLEGVKILFRQKNPA